jgi:23S rRNA pseudouridine955/2504/2580 synthase/23S rRNA pseudouridine1911/1915/1917 synthase
MSIKINVPEHIVYEDNYILVINKPGGLMVEPDRNGHLNLLHQVQQYERAKHSKGKEIFVQHVHRLDRPTFGLVLFAKKKSVLKNLSEQFAQRTTEKKYFALTETSPRLDTGTFTHWHYKNSKLKKAELYLQEMPNTCIAELTYITNPKESCCEWEITLLTGRYHQIRAQLSFEKMPIIGDVLYGSNKSYALHAIALQAYSLKINHPITNERMHFEIEKIKY